MIEMSRDAVVLCYIFAHCTLLKAVTDQSSDFHFSGHTSDMKIGTQHWLVANCFVEKFYW